MDPGAHWGEIQDFWKEVQMILQEGGPDLPEYPAAEIGDLEVWSYPWARTPVRFHASPVLQRLAMGAFAYALDTHIPAVKLQAEVRLGVLTALLARRLTRELESFYVHNPDITRLSSRAESHICSGWEVRYLQVGYIDLRTK